MINQITLQQLMSDMRGLGNRIATIASTLSARINGHINTKGNAHGMEPADIGLDRVANYAPATKAEAAKAVNNTTVMTPKRTLDFVEENVYKPIGELFKDAADRLP
ncbi:tail protein [Pseudomonas phage Psa21]|uniref:Virion structural protein n=1 Tax=Pseudomonas phage Psa21 TaxID=2530023 RepID=A0A481W4M2_9CAUD|nr:tail protein [Pseudomonas phage Psa21]QBJ02711.1 hypothetical protein PSA21_185 [Pseudomonas phage Psa21]